MQQPNFTFHTFLWMYVAEKNMPWSFCTICWTVQRPCVRLLICNILRSHCELWEGLWFERVEITPRNEIDSGEQPLKMALWTERMVGWDLQLMNWHIFIPVPVILRWEQHLCVETHLCCPVSYLINKTVWVLNMWDLFKLWTAHRFSYCCGFNTGR